MILSREDNWQKHASLLKSAVYYENLTEYENYSKYLRQKYEKIERKFSIAHFYFRQLTVYQFERDERYSLIDCIGTTYIHVLLNLCRNPFFEIIASFGGIVGLCLGASLISLVELVYYFTLRVMIDNKAKNKMTT